MRRVPTLRPRLVAALLVTAIGAAVAWRADPGATSTAGGREDDAGRSRPAARSATAGAGAAARSGAALVSELGCAACHTGLPVAAAPMHAPALDDAGLRYSTAYLFDYLRSPRPVRAHIGAARMPDFGLDEREGLALALYLSTLREGGGRRTRLRLPRIGGRLDADGLMAGELGCTACHSLGGAGATAAPDLALAGARLRPGWIEGYLADPARRDPGTPMPSVFYVHDADGSRRERVPDATEKLRAVSRRITELGERQRTGWTAALERARREHPDVDARLGRRIFISQNCAGCHSRSPARRWPNAPDLAVEGLRVRPEWLRAFLARPAPVRPFGYFPGSGSRMPDFRLTEDEADSISVFLLRLRADGAEPPATAARGPAAPAIGGGALSAASARRAESLLRDRLPCLGCHSLDGEGGRIGPDLSTASVRLRPSWIRAMITSPERTVPGTVMPRTAMPDATRELLIAYLQSRTGAEQDAEHAGGSPARGQPTANAPERLSLADHPIHFPAALSSGRGLYGRYCAACHGIGGDGDGYNSRYLPVSPTAHADASLMADRPDDTLFDGVHAGGAVLGRSHRMPGFGARLTGDEIRLLVRYIRELCDCSPPGWSIDGGGGR